MSRLVEGGRDVPSTLGWSENIFFAKCKVLMVTKLPYAIKTSYAKFELDL